MEYKTYMADDGTIRRRPLTNERRALSQPSESNIIIRDDGTLYNPTQAQPTPTTQITTNTNAVEQPKMSLFGKILTGVMIAVCIIGIPLFLNLNWFFGFYKGFGLALIVLWALPVVLFFSYCFYIEKEQNRIVDAWFCASMVTLFQSLIIWQGAGGYLGAIFGWIILFLASIFINYIIAENDDMEIFLRVTNIVSFCVFFFPCFVISASLCGGRLNRISSLSGFLIFLAVFPAFVDIGIASVITVKEIKK